MGYVIIFTMKALSRALLLAALALAAGGCRGTAQEIDDSDPAIKARVETALRGRKDLNVRFVSVDVTGGTVTISGVVDSQAQIVKINKIIRLTHGVDGVLNNLVVQE